MTSIYIFVSAFKDSDGFGKIIFMLLFSVSFISWFMLLYKARQFAHLEKQMHAFLENFQKKEQSIFEKTFLENLSSSPLFLLYKNFKKCAIDLFDRNRQLDGVDINFLSRSDVEMLNNFLEQKILWRVKRLKKIFLFFPLRSRWPLFWESSEPFGDSLLALLALEKGGRRYLTRL